VRDEIDVCWKFASGETCPNGSRYPFLDNPPRIQVLTFFVNLSCRFSHDLPAYLKAKPKDLFWPAHPPPISENAPFVPPHETQSSDLIPSVDLSTTCPIFLEKGSCKHGLKCRFLGGHIRHTNSGNDDIAALAIARDETVPSSRVRETTETNAIDQGVLKQLRSRKVSPLTTSHHHLLIHILSIPPHSPTLISSNLKIAHHNGGTMRSAPILPFLRPRNLKFPQDLTPQTCLQGQVKRSDYTGKGKHVSSFGKALFCDWNQHYFPIDLAPLTTVGNLPFRRLASSLGADITCSEMALSHSLLSASKEEWSLVRRHPSERIFGVQVAGGKPGLLARAAEVLAREIGSGNPNGIDFVDLNCGCPIDIVFQTGAGSALKFHRLTQDSWP
jgi:tRNA-dihydrouridine synthase 3